MRKHGCKKGKICLWKAALPQQSSIGCNFHDIKALTNTLQDFPRINTEGAGHVCAWEIG